MSAREPEPWRCRYCRFEAWAMRDVVRHEEDEHPVEVAEDEREWVQREVEGR